MHDGLVKLCLKGVASSLPAPSAVVSGPDVVQQILTVFRDDPEKEKLEDVLARVSIESDTYDDTGESEIETIARVWERSFASENADVQEELQKSLRDALLDCRDGNGGQLVCKTG